MELWSVGEALEGQASQLPWLSSCPRGFRSWASWMLCYCTGAECLLPPDTSPGPRCFGIAWEQRRRCEEAG